jgi:hypothetical protein
MTPSVTRMPTRAELKARRSAAKHAQRVATAATPQAVLAAATDEIKAILARSDGPTAAQVAARAAQALRMIADDANSQVRRGARRYVA